ncbi:ABC transporter (iron.B12.siderophore.hemin), periplasmic substrate-binding component [Leucobacter sp. 7(1)]|nr:ABC transporter (iron.B12.siderophore.hemin), periplasmic substrate-binding component [Leucobacter sp. 7(1)]
MDAGAAAFIAALGFSDRIVGTAAPDFVTDFEGDLRTQLDAVPVLDTGTGSAEAVIAAEPDLVTGISQYEFGGFDGTATVDQLRAAGSAALSACRTEQSGPVEDIDETYRYITALADAFDVPERGAALVARIREEVSTNTAQSVSEDVPVLTLSSVPDGGGGVSTAGGSSFANGIITLAHGTNIASDQLQDFASLSAEAVAAADPKVIVVISGFSAEDDVDLKASIVASPLLSSTTAVHSGNVVIVPQRLMLSPSLLNAQAVKVVADAVARAAD